MSIRNRLLLLVFAVWLPAVLGFALLAHATYLREEESARQTIAELGRNLLMRVEREFDTRVALARTLAASSAVRDGQLARFHEDASAAVRGTGDWAMLIDSSGQIVNTLRPYDASLPPLPSPALVTQGPDIQMSPRGALSQAPVLRVLVPAPQLTPPRYNVGVSLKPAVIQAIAEDLNYPVGSLGAVIDHDQRVVARSRDPQLWFGKPATGDIKARALARQDGFVQSVTLDGVPSLTYLVTSPSYGWSAVIALPARALTDAAWRLTLQAMAASGLLLVIGLGLAYYAARRISTPVLALRESAMQLGRDEIPPRLSTGVSEADEVSAALHEAGRRSHEATRTLELRVQEAVQRNQEAQAKLLDAQKHEAIGRLTGGIAHDFNNLLQTITTGLHILERSVTEAPQRRVLDSATRASAKAADLIRQMLTFGRVQPLRPQPVNFSDVVLKSQELTAKAVGEGVQLSADIDPHLPTLHVDTVQLELALLNLVFNARDAMPRGGHVRITARVAQGAETVQLGPGPWVCVEVADDGTGMDTDTQARAFEPYFTTKPVGAGSGLGLPQAMAFARQSGGDIRLHSTPGLGTRVRLYLPASGLPAPGAEPAPRVAGTPRALKVLMVEDDLLVSSVVVPALQGEGHAVTLCHTADEAQLRLSNGAGFDVLFTDVVMPGRLSGIDLVRWCHEHRPGLGAVLATGYTAQKLDLPVHSLQKPYGLGTLLATLQQAANGVQA